METQNSDVSFLFVQALSSLLNLLVLMNLNHTKQRLIFETNSVEEQKSVLRYLDSRKISIAECDCS